MRKRLPAGTVSISQPSTITTWPGASCGLAPTPLTTPAARRCGVVRAIWLRFAQMHINGGVLNGTRILREESARIMQNLTVESDEEPGRKYGVGWWGDSSIGRRNFSHSGGGPGMGVMLSAYPDDNTITVVLTNYYGAMAPGVAKRLIGV